MAAEGKNIEELFLEIDKIIERMESGEAPLEELFSLYESGMKKLKLCSEKLDCVEKKMLVINGGDAETAERE